MTDLAKKILRKIRGTRLPQKPLVSMAEARAKHDILAKEAWERDKKVNRNAAFKKAQIKLAEYREQVQAEKERQVQIAETRLKNLKKARRAKRRKQ